MTTWKEALAGKVGSLKFMQEIIDQIPEANGARAAFETLLNVLTDGKPKFRYLIVDEDYNVTGTNDEDLAKEIAESFQTYDVVTFKGVGGTGDPTEHQGLGPDSHDSDDD